MPEFASRWPTSALTEKGAAQTHSIVLCQDLGEPWPTPGNPTDMGYAFEKGAEKTGGGHGFADVWLRGHFAWEYKEKGRYLGALYRQLLEHKEALENPPLLVVCDLERFEVHSNLTNTVKRVYAFALADLLVSQPTPTSPKPPLDVLWALWDDRRASSPGTPPPPSPRCRRAARPARREPALARGGAGGGHAGRVCVRHGV